MSADILPFDDGALQLRGYEAATVMLGRRRRRAVELETQRFELEQLKAQRDANRRFIGFGQGTPLELDVGAFLGIDRTPPKGPDGPRAA